MNTWTVSAARMVRVTRGTRVAFTEGLRIKFGEVTDVLHDHYRIACADGCVRRILKERVEPLTDAAGSA
jgi:hypothetical protein